LTMQVKLLRAIQERKVRKVGATSEEPVDVRLISATHKNLPRMVAEGLFRQDLFYRLNVIELRMPSLRERKTDIPSLADHLLARIAERHALKQPKLTRGAIEQLMAHDFPGNVRELENLLERTVALAGEGVIEADDLRIALTRCRRQWKQGQLHPHPLQRVWHCPWTCRPIWIRLNAI
jgi:two-component system, NtrC family, response regulator PilR